MTDLPVYKMIAVGTRLNNSTLAEQLLSTYQSLIAAKYAEAYIHGSAEDLRRAIARYGTVKSSTSLLDEATKLNTNIDTVEAEARSVVMQAFSQTSNAWQLVEQLQSIERAVHANVSSSLRTSLAFGQTLNAGVPNEHGNRHLRQRRHLVLRDAGYRVVHGKRHMDRPYPLHAVERCADLDGCCAW
ncbi:traH family domain protein (plasmid) [Burkholderia cepacia]|nr:traH family domain protein [Burkholderia cepacia]